MIRKTAYFDDHWGEGWPDLAYIESRIANPVGRARFFEGGQDGGSIFIESSDGTEASAPHSARSKVALYLHSIPNRGVKLQYTKWDGRQLRTFHSKGDVSLLQKFVRSFHDTPLSLGLFVPFDLGWRAIHEFMVSDGALPASIEWIANEDLPPETFPAP